MGPVPPLAHGAGFDEAAILLAPVLVFLVLRYLSRQAPDDPEEPGGADERDGHGADDRDEPDGQAGDDSESA